jgi:chloride channel 7
VFAGGNLALLLLASSITSFVSPAAGGSGIPEVKAYLNGVDAPNIFSLRTLAVKVRRRRACLLVFLSFPILPGLAVAFLLPAHGPHLAAASSALCTWIVHKH